MGIFDSPGLKTVPDTSNQQSISTYAQPYVSDLLGKTQALTDNPTTSYTGQLTAGPSTIQNYAWNGLANLTLPEGLTGAGANLNDISQQAQDLSFTPQNFTNTYNAPNPYQGITALNQYNATPAYQGAVATNQYSATNPYTASNIQNTYQAAGQNFVPTNVTTGNFDQAAAQQYMNPYIQTALNPQLEALQRQAAINQQGDLAKLTQAGAYGGSRQSILQGQNNYNLLAQQANLIGQGYNQAYNQAGQQFTSDQARQLQAQQSNVDQAKYAAQLGMTDAQLMAQYGMTAAQANEASRQFSQQQSLANAQNTAQYGQTAQAANIQQQQFAQQQALANAQNSAQYGTTAQAANIQQGQFGATQAMTAAQQQAQALQAQQAAQEAAKQFGASYGLQGLQAATTAQQAAANAGAQQAQYGLANLQALSTAGNTQQTQNQAALNAQYNEYLRQLQYPQTMLTLQKNILSGLPITTQQNYKAQSSVAQSAAGAAGTVMDLVGKMKAQGMAMPDISKYINSLTSTNPKQTGGIKIDENGNLQYPTAPGGSSPYDDQGNLMPGWSVDENNNPVWVSSDYVEPTSSVTQPDTTVVPDNIQAVNDYWANYDPNNP